MHIRKNYVAGSGRTVFPQFVAMRSELFSHMKDQRDVSN